jgi:glycosyltransferase involved in cell wall biosynthesis
MYQLDVRKLQLIYRGVDTSQYTPAFQPDEAWKHAWFAEYPHLRGKRLLVLPARVSRWKGAADFVDMLSIVCQQHKNVHALLVGEVAADKHAFAACLQQKIDKAGLSECITLTGYRQDVKEIMAMASIVYSLSTEPEAFGRSTLEALSLGIPVIGYQHGGVAEQLAALLPEGAVPVGHVAEVAMLTLSWLEQPPTVLPNTQFSLQVMQQKTLAVYHDVMADPAQAGEPCA